MMLLLVLLVFLSSINGFSSPRPTSVTLHRHHFFGKTVCDSQRLFLYKDPSDSPIIFPKEQHPRRKRRGRRRRNNNNNNRARRTWHSQNIINSHLEKTVPSFFRYPRRWMVGYYKKLGYFLLSLKYSLIKLWRFLTLERYTIYVLQCENNKYYVGSTKYREKRYGEHFSKRGGSAWTRVNRPLLVKDEFRRIPKRFVLGLEAQVTADYMLRYGIHNVRGAMFCTLRPFTKGRDLDTLVGFLGHYQEMDYRGVREVLLEREFKNNTATSNYYEAINGKRKRTHDLGENDDNAQKPIEPRESWEGKSIWSNVTLLRDQQIRYNKS